MMIVIGRKYRFTAQEIGEVAVARLTQMHVAALICGCCGRITMMMSRDSGITAKWAPAANVLDRLRRGNVIDGSSLNGRLD